VEIDNYQGSGEKLLTDSEHSVGLIYVRAVISCPSCDYKTVFKNQFLRKDIEQIKVTLKVFDWMVCDKCGDLLNLNLEFKI
jgi:hypothetical protein